METNRDFRRATVSGINGLPRRRQGITTLRDSTDEERQTELKETVRFRDRERLQKKEQNREFAKRRRVDRSAVEQKTAGGGGGDSYRENESTDSSDEEYCEDEEQLKNYHHKGTNQLSPSSFQSNNRRGLRTLRSSPVFKSPSDEIFGVPVPRRARSVSEKKLQKCWISGSTGFGEDWCYRRFSPAKTSPVGFGGGSLSYSMKMKSAESRTRILSSASNLKSSAIEDDIEIEVAEALFDLMKQSHSQPQSFKIQENVDGESMDTYCEVQRLKAEGGGDENNSFSVPNEQPKEASAETMTDLKKERRDEKEKFSDDPADGLVGEDGFVNKGTLGSQKENKSPSCVKVNACDIKDPTVTKAEHGATVVGSKKEARLEIDSVESKKEARLEIDLMASPPLTSSLARDALVETEIRPKVSTQVVRKRSEALSPDDHVRVAIRSQKEAIGPLSADQLPELDFEKPGHGILSDSNLPMQKHQPHGQNYQKNQPSSMLPFPIGTGNLSGSLPHPGYMPPLQTALPIDGRERSTMIMRPPQFKLSLPQPKICATHQYIAHNINHHLQLIKKSLSSEPIGPVTSYGAGSSNPKTMLPTHKLGGSGNDNTPCAMGSFSARSGAKPLLHQASHQGPVKNLLQCPGFTFPLGHHNASMMTPAGSPGQPQSASTASSASLTCTSSGKPSENLSFPPVSFNNTAFPSNETAPYMTMLQNNGGPIPISTNIPLPSFKGVTPSMPLLNSSVYSSSVYNVNNQHQFSPHHAPVQPSSQNTAPFNGSSSHKQPACQKLASSISENKIPISAAADLMGHPNWPAYSSRKSESEIDRKSSSLVADDRASHSVKSNNHAGSSFPVQPMNFPAMPPLSISGAGALDNKNGEHSQQGPKGRVELMPPTIALSFGTNPSTDTAANFSSMLQNPALFEMLYGTHMAQQKNFQSSEGKFRSSTDQSFNFSKADVTDMSPSSAMLTCKSDGLTRTAYYCPSSLSGNQPFQASSAAVTSGVPPTIPNFQQLHHQQQLTQLQQHHVHQMQLAGASVQVEASGPNSIQGSYLGSSLPSNSPVYSQVSTQADMPSFPSKWMNLSQPAPSGIGSIHPLKTSAGQTHITFGNCSASAGASLQRQHIMIKGQPESSLMNGPNSSISKNTSRATPSVSSPQETGTFPIGPSQKSPPACRRNIPSILSTCPNQLPELRY